MTDWFRTWHGAPSDPKWRMIAKKASVRAGDVWAVVSYLFDRASQAEDRGSVAGYDAELIAEIFGYEADDVTRIIHELEAKNVIMGGRLTAWDKYQPKREDGSQERAKAWRDRKKDEEERSRTQPNAGKRPEERRVDTDEIRIIEPLAQHPIADALPNEHDGLLEKLLVANGISGFRAERNIGLVSLAPVFAWISGGLDVDLDIVPAIAAKPKPAARSWTYFEGQVREFAQQRRSISAIGSVPAPSVNWAGRLDVFHSSGTWSHAWGPKPGEAGCRVPPNFCQQDAA
jgi:hypothetical protein